jgi:PAS domain-containing protein
LNWFSTNFIDVLPTAVYVCNSAAVIVAYNQRATELWGRTPT